LLSGRNGCGCFGKAFSMALTVKRDCVYWVKLGKSRMQVRVLRRAPGLPDHWQCQSIRSGTTLLVPATAFESLVEGQPECEDSATSQ
jgi:hypothetical protein